LRDYDDVRLFPQPIADTSEWPEETLRQCGMKFETEKAASSLRQPWNVLK